ncbi:MAG TPA: flagellar basal body-associated FliL family protein [Verrucomicrobiae bacterium]|jgi:flagellar basal body-associated protein FliL|nr:flagellar basal body-associated FliL family protein [Verrucomicrobiae bacterium]
MFTIQITKRVIIASILTFVIATLLGAGWFYGRELLHPGAVAQETSPRDITLELEPFVVNLSGDAGRYLRASISVGVDSERDKQMVKTAASRVRDSLILLLSGKTADRLLAPDGKTELRGEIVEGINAAVGGDVVNTIYFREFLIQ